MQEFVNQLKTAMIYASVIFGEPIWFTLSMHDVVPVRLGETEAQGMPKFEGSLR